MHTLSIISPTTIIGKIIYRGTCDSKIPWDKTLPDWIKKKWEKWEKKLSPNLNIPRAINLGQEVLEMINVHIFRDSSLLGTCAC